MPIMLRTEDKTYIRTVNKQFFVLPPKNRHTNVQSTEQKKNRKGNKEKNGNNHLCNIPLVHKNYEIKKLIYLLYLSLNVNRSSRVTFHSDASIDKSITWIKGDTKKSQFTTKRIEMSKPMRLKG